MRISGKLPKMIVMIPSRSIQTNRKSGKRFIRSFALAGLMLGFLGIALFGGRACFADPPEEEGWFFPYIGSGNGLWEIDAGAFFWSDRFEVRNLQLLTDIDIAPGVRWHSLVRSNRERDTLAGFEPFFDEGYLEMYGFHRGKKGQFSASLKVGVFRYLHFPYPDAIAVFDQVPGISDLNGGEKTGYGGSCLVLDYAHDSGWGLHFTGLEWGFGYPDQDSVIEAYLSFKKEWGQGYRFEARVGKLQVRPEPLGRGERGWNVFFGKAFEAGSVGFLYEKLENQPAYTGLMVTFPVSPKTQLLGSVAFDYARSPEGLAVHLPVAWGTIGRVSRRVPDNSEAVGGLKAERLRTYWQNSQVRNYYEHRLDHWGETYEKGLFVVMEEEPWTLQAEALVSPHTSFGSWDDLRDWERDRQGPAQISQEVTYRFYRVEPR